MHILFCAVGFPYKNKTSAGPGWPPAAKRLEQRGTEAVFYFCEEIPLRKKRRSTKPPPPYLQKQNPIQHDA
jgi:hypothetical protein